ncbi:hypothetical protein Tco_0640624 [Tanacetum coccineum]
MITTSMSCLYYTIMEITRSAKCRKTKDTVPHTQTESTITVFGPDMQEIPLVEFQGDLSRAPHSQKRKGKSDLIVDQKFCLSLLGVDEAHNGWLLGKHLDAWIDLMWNVRPAYADWAIASSYFCDFVMRRDVPGWVCNGVRISVITLYDSISIPDDESRDWWSKMSVLLLHFKMRGRRDEKKRLDQLLNRSRGCVMIRYFEKKEGFSREKEGVIKFVQTESDFSCKELSSIYWQENPLVTLGGPGGPFFLRECCIWVSTDILGFKMNLSNGGLSKLYDEGERGKRRCDDFKVEWRELAFDSLRSFLATICPDVLQLIMNVAKGRMLEPVRCSENNASSVEDQDT